MKSQKAGISIYLLCQCPRSLGQWDVLVLPTLGRWTQEDQELGSVPQLLSEFDISLATRQPVSESRGAGERAQESLAAPTESQSSHAHL